MYNYYDKGYSNREMCFKKTGISIYRKHIIEEQINDVYLNLGTNLPDQEMSNVTFGDF